MQRHIIFSSKSPAILTVGTFKRKSKTFSFSPFKRYCPLIRLFTYAFYKERSFAAWINTITNHWFSYLKSTFLLLTYFFQCNLVVYQGKKYLSIISVCASCELRHIESNLWIYTLFSFLFDFTKHFSTSFSTKKNSFLLLLLFIRDIEMQYGRWWNRRVYWSMPMNRKSVNLNFFPVKKHYAKNFFYRRCINH
jgi:hypothetical protein